jgi:hypothetical protein
VKRVQTALRKRSESQAADACEHGLFARPDFQFGDAGFQFRRRESAVVNVRVSAPKLQTVGVVRFKTNKFAIQTTSYLFESFSLVLERHVLVVDDVLEQLTYGLAGFIFALLLETFGRHLLTVGQRYGVVRIKTDLMRHPQRAEGRKKTKKRKGGKRGQRTGEEEKNKNKQKNRKLKHRYKPNINTRTLIYSKKNYNFS